MKLCAHLITSFLGKKKKEYICARLIAQTLKASSLLTTLEDRTHYSLSRGYSKTTSLSQWTAP